MTEVIKYDVTKTRQKRKSDEIEKHENINPNKRSAKITDSYNRTCRAKVDGASKPSGLPRLMNKSSTKTGGGVTQAIVEMATVVADDNLSQRSGDGISLLKSLLVAQMGIFENLQLFATRSEEVVRKAAENLKAKQRTQDHRAKLKTCEQAIKELSDTLITVSTQLKDSRERAVSTHDDMQTHVDSLMGFTMKLDVDIAAMRAKAHAIQEEKETMTLELSEKLVAAHSQITELQNQLKCSNCALIVSESDSKLAHDALRSQFEEVIVPLHIFCESSLNFIWYQRVESLEKEILSLQKVLENFETANSNTEKKLSECRGELNSTQTDLRELESLLHRKQEDFDDILKDYDRVKQKLHETELDLRCAAFERQ